MINMKSEKWYSEGLNLLLLVVIVIILPCGSIAMMFDREYQDLGVFGSIISLVGIFLKVSYDNHKNKKK